MKYKLKTTPKIKKTKMQYLDCKSNGKHLNLFEIKMAWWLVLLPSPKEMRVTKFNKGEWEKGGFKAFKRPNGPKLYIIFCKNKSYLLQIMLKCTTRVSKLKFFQG
jgi:hypothetical protein